MKILNAEPQLYSRQAFAILGELGEVTEKDLSQQQLEEAIGSYDVLIVRLRFHVTRDLIQKAKKLKYILSATTGTDHIDLLAAEEHGIKVVCLKGEEIFLRSIPSTAEHTWALLLAVLRHIPSAVQSVRQGVWNRDTFRGHNLARKQVGILGLGRVGKQVANFAKAFSCQVAAYDPLQNSWLDYVKRFSEPRQLFEWSDILCIHIPYSKETHHYIGEELLKHARKGIVLINTSRGGVWDENIVARYTQQGTIQGVGTDVLEAELDTEKRWDSPLLKLMHDGYNVVITPHIAGATFESMEMTEVFIANRLKSIVND